MKQKIHKVPRLKGTLKVPGDKSIAHRALMLGAIARGRQIVEGLPDATDVNSTITCLRELGCFVETMPDGRTMVMSRGIGAEAKLDAGNSGTTARLLTGLVAGHDTTCTIDGDESLRRRPMARVAEPLAKMGARITTAEDGRLPLTIQGGNLKGITYDLPVASAQVKSALLLAGLRAEGVTTVREPVPTRDHTERLLGAMGVDVLLGDKMVGVTGGAKLIGTEVFVPGDFSSAAFLIVAALCLPGSEIYLPVTGVNPTRTGLLETLTEMGAEIILDNPEVMSGEPVSDLLVRSAPLKAVEITDPSRVAAMIDEFPALAVAATQAEGQTVVRGVGELRRKESDRIHAISETLTMMGADIEEFEDGFAIRGPQKLRGASVSSHGDHRIAMAAAVAGLIATGETEIVDAGTVDVSYPGFFSGLKALAG